MLKKVAQRGRSERSDEVKTLSDARTKLASFFSILLKDR